MSENAWDNVSTGHDGGRTQLTGAAVLPSAGLEGSTAKSYITRYPSIENRVPAKVFSLAVSATTQDLGTLGNVQVHFFKAGSLWQRGQEWLESDRHLDGYRRNRPCCVPELLLGKYRNAKAHVEQSSAVELSKMFRSGQHALPNV